MYINVMVLSSVWVFCIIIKWPQVSTMVVNLRPTWIVWMASNVGCTFQEITNTDSSSWDANFLAHLSTKCSSELLWSFNVRRPSSVCACVRPCVRASTISLNNISSETAYWILTKLQRNDPWVVLYQSCSNRSSWLHK